MSEISHTIKCTLCVINYILLQLFMISYWFIHFKKGAKSDPELGLLKMVTLTITFEKQYVKIMA